MGYKEECFNINDPKEIIKNMIDTPFSKMQGITYERLVKEGQVKPIRTVDSMKETFPLLSILSRNRA